MSRRARVRDERGAVAVMVGILAVVLIGVSAFTVDFGMAYVSKRQLQTASDAGALAAAAVYADQSGTCADLAGDASLQAEAQQAADAISDPNRPDRDPGVVEPTCGDGGRLDVTYGASGNTPVTLGGVLTDDSDIDTNGSATASLDVPGSAIGVLPYLICSSQVPDADLPAETWTKVTFDKDSDPACDHPPGNWFTVDCPGDGNNGTLVENTENGCEDPVSLADTDSTSPQDLHDSLVSACSEDDDADCLTANPGNDIHNSKNLDAWNALIGTTALFPVICAEDACSPSAYEGNGNNATYPVYRFAAVKVCGWHWQHDYSGAYSSHVTPDADDPCSGADSNSGVKENALLLAFTLVQTSGTTAPSACALGLAACDTGVRRVLLTN